jgi:hypothetical protein
MRRNGKRTTFEQGHTGPVRIEPVQATLDLRILGSDVKQVASAISGRGLMESGVLNVDNGSIAGKNAFLQVYSTRPNVPWRPWTRAPVPAKEQV